MNYSYTKHKLKNLNQVLDIKMASSSSNQVGAGTTISALHSDIIETHLLTKFDGPSLASLASTSNLLHTLCNKQSLWEQVCNSAWNSIAHPLVRQAISSFPGSYRSFYSDSFPVLTATNCSRGSPSDPVQTSELISAVDVHYGNNPVYSKVRVTNTDNSSFHESLFCVDLIDHKETVEMPLRYEGDLNMCMSELQQNLRLSWIVIDPTLKRAANVSSLRPVSVRPHWDKSGIEVTYATIISGDCCGTDTTELVECRVVALFGYEEGNNIELKELGLCLVDMVKMRVNGEMSLRILKQAMQRGERRKEFGQGKEMYAKYSNSEQRQRFIFWVFFAISMITSVYLITRP